jgi:hypothetical protein
MANICWALCDEDDDEVASCIEVLGEGEFDLGVELVARAPIEEIPNDFEQIEILA